MNDVLEIVSRLEEVGGRLAWDGERIRYAIPTEDAEAQSLLAELRKRKSEVAELLKMRAAVPTMPAGVRLIEWNLKEPPVAIDVCSVVTDPALFARRALEELRIALANQTARRKRYVGWAVPQLLDRLAQVGVVVELECSKNPISAGPVNG